MFINLPIHHFNLNTRNSWHFTLHHHSRGSACDVSSLQPMQIQVLRRRHIIVLISKYSTSVDHMLTCCRPLFFLSTFLIFAFYVMSSGTSHNIPVPASPPQDFHFKYTVQKGFFLQSEDSTDDTTFDFVRRIIPYVQKPWLIHNRRSRTSG